MWAVDARVGVEEVGKELEVVLAPPDPVEILARHVLVRDPRGCVQRRPSGVHLHERAPLGAPSVLEPVCAERHEDEQSDGENERGSPANPGLVDDDCEDRCERDGDAEERVHADEVQRADQHARRDRVGDADPTRNLGRCREDHDPRGPQQERGGREGHAQDHPGTEHEDRRDDDDALGDRWPTAQRERKRPDRGPRADLQHVERDAVPRQIGQQRVADPHHVGEHRGRDHERRAAVPGVVAVDDRVERRVVVDLERGLAQRDQERDGHRTDQQRETDRERRAPPEAAPCSPGRAARRLDFVGLFRGVERAHLGQLTRHPAPPAMAAPAATRPFRRVPPS